MRKTVRVLAIETSTSLFGAAVIEGDNVLCEEALDIPRAHSSMLLPLCDSALRKARVIPSMLSAVAVSVGPGSFTGLRIGCATAQGLAHAWGKPVVTVPTFAALVQQACQGNARSGRSPKVAVVQGRAKAQTVTALYEWDGVEAVLPGARSIPDFARILSSTVRGPVLVTGDAADLFVDYFEDEGRDIASEIELTVVGGEARLPRPESVARLGVRMFRDGLSVEPRAAVPRYLRKSQAEAVRLRKSETD